MTYFFGIFFKIPTPGGGGGGAAAHGGGGERTQPALQHAPAISLLGHPSASAGSR